MDKIVTIKEITPREQAPVNPVVGGRNPQKKKPAKYPDPIITKKPQKAPGEERIAKNGWLTWG